MDTTNSNQSVLERIVEGITETVLAPVRALYGIGIDPERERLYELIWRLRYNIHRIDGCRGHESVGCRWDGQAHRSVQDADRKLLSDLLEAESATKQKSQVYIPPELEARARELGVSGKLSPKDAFVYETGVVGSLVVGGGAGPLWYSAQGDSALAYALMFVASLVVGVGSLTKLLDTGIDKRNLHH